MMPNKRGNWYDDMPSKRMNRHGSMVAEDDVETDIRDKVAKQYQEKVIALYKICKARGGKMMFEQHEASSIQMKPQFPRLHRWHENLHSRLAAAEGGRVPGVRDDGVKRRRGCDSVRVDDR